MREGGGYAPLFPVLKFILIREFDSSIIMLICFNALLRKKLQLRI